jgi:putative transposase
MPSRNIVREFAPDSYYHVYNRGVEKRVIFTDEQDYSVFLGLLKKYLAGELSNEANRHQFKNFHGELSLLTYCLMPNHFHLLFYQSSENAITELMRRVSTSYVMYFNNRHNRVGSLFQGPYKASKIDADEYLDHVSRYIHLNPRDYKTWPYSSLAYYQANKKANWLDTNNILSRFNNSRESYLKFVSDYESNKAEIDLLKWQLANGADATLC